MLGTSLRRAVAATLVAVAAVACGSTEPQATTIESAVFADTLDIVLSDFTRLPEGLYRRDSIVGVGREVVAGDSVSVRYVARYTDARLVSEIPPSRPALAYRVGTGRVIAGWELGIPGMQVGGRRQLIVPPELGYGSRDYLGVPGGSILVFTIDLVALH